MLATRHTLVGTLGNQVPELHGNGRPALMRHKLYSRFTIVLCCGNGNQTGVVWGFELQFNWLSSGFPSNSLKNSVIFDEYCKQLLALSISERCDLVHYILEIWFVVIIW